MSDLVPYEIRDFYFDSVSDHLDRRDVTASGSQLLPRLVDDPLSAKQRFTKFKPPKPVRLRLDLTDAPKTFVNVTQSQPERPTTKDRQPATPRKTRDIFYGLRHLDRRGAGGKRI